MDVVTMQDLHGYVREWAIESWPQKYGVLVRVNRLMRRMTQDQLARAVGVSRYVIGRYERGEVVPDVRLHCEIARALDCQPGDILPVP